MKLEPNNGNKREDALELVDRIAVLVENIESIIAREAARADECECLRGGWMYQLMDSLERIYDVLTQLRVMLRERAA
jgi:hypothetical protein